MILKSLRLVNFRCYNQLELDFDENFNIFIGNNGHGKTSVLEAINVLSVAKSFRDAKNLDLVKIGAAEGRIEGQANNRGLDSVLTLDISQKGKLAKINGKSCQFLSDYFGKLWTVSFCPGDLEIVRGGPEYRRNWLDHLSSVLMPEHLKILLNYQRALKQRNKVLRDSIKGQMPIDEDLLDLWTQELLTYGAQVIHNRRQSVDNLQEHFKNFFLQFSGIVPVDNLLKENHDTETLEVALKYFFSQEENEDPGQEVENSLASITHKLAHQLAKVRAKEKVLGVTLVGPHRDNVDIFFQGRQARVMCSQGESRTVVLALKMAEATLIHEQRKEKPVVLVDDFSSELDEKRRTILLDYLSQLGAQVFLTTTEKVIKGRTFQVNAGSVAQYVQ